MQLVELVDVVGVPFVQFLHLFCIQRQLSFLLFYSSLLLGKLLPGYLWVLVLVLLVNASPLQLVITALSVLLYQFLRIVGADQVPVVGNVRIGVRQLRLTVFKNITLIELFEEIAIMMEIHLY